MPKRLSKLSKHFDSFSFFESTASSENKNKSEMGTKSKKPSVREELKNIKEEQKAKLDLDNSDRKKDVPNKVAEHKQPTPKKKKSKERG